MIRIKNIQKQDYFVSLLNSVHQCDLCPRMCGRRKVLSSVNGNLNAKIVFIAEAPGRLGAECTGIPLYGDKSGDNFELLLSNIGWLRSDIFITNAILCNPQNEEGNNAPPEKEEIINCNYYLKMTLELINPDVVVTIGAKALDALNLIAPHTFTLKKDVATVKDWNGRKLFPLYHTGPRALVHRSQIQQRADFIALSHIVDPKSGLKNRNSVSSRAVPPSHQITPILIDMVAIILDYLKEISFFKLTKLLYLIDYNYFEQFGQSISGCIYLRMQEGPWIPYLKDISKVYDGSLFDTHFISRKPYILLHVDNYKSQTLNDDKIIFIRTICEKYKNHDDASIKTAAYYTKPMKYILRQEKKGRKMTKIPVLYGNKTVIDMDIQPTDSTTLKSNQ